MSQSDGRKKILLAIHLDTFFSGLVGVARLLKESEQYEPLLFFAQDYANLYGDLAICEAEKLPYLYPRGPMTRLVGITSADGRPPLIRRLIKQWLSYFPKATTRMIVSWFREVTIDTVFYQYWKLSSRLRYITCLIREESISLVVLAGDVIHYDTSVFTKAAHLEHIPAVIVPGWMADATEPAEAFGYDPRYQLQQRWTNRLAGRLYPHWVYKYKGQELIRLPAGHVLAREWLGLAPPSPWILHSGDADAIALESEAMREYCLSAGLPPDQLALTGSVNHDNLVKILKEATQRRADLYRRLDLPADRPLILSALPPNEFYRTGGRPECNFQVYEELVEFWVQSLAAVKGYNVVISLHPSIKFEQLQYIEQWGVRIARDHTVGLVPLCDIFVASVSTTIQWAIVCGKPVVNYDVYRFGYTDYALAKGVITVEEKKGFIAVLQRLVKDRAFYEDIAMCQKACSDRWGRLDGLASERILQLFDQLVAKYQR